MDEIVQFDFPTDSPKIIKVIGVGGGGGNAVNHMGCTCSVQWCYSALVSG